MKPRVIRCSCGTSAEPPAGMSRVKFARTLAVHGWVVAVDGVKVTSAKCDQCAGKREAMAA